MNGRALLAALLVAALFLTSSDGAAEEPGTLIVVDQFGYLPDADKVAVLRDPVKGYDADLDYAPGKRLDVVSVADGEVVFSAAPVAWNDGRIDDMSGDRVWWFDFSALTAPGRYVVIDADNGQRSPEFSIGEDVYRPVLREALRTFYYQRAGFPKKPPYADPSWQDDASHLGPGQDTEARLYSARDDASTERDLSGGWFDAGDFHRYTAWHANNVVTMLHAWLENPDAWDDAAGIPESGNGIPDLVDEILFGLEWQKRMQDGAGGEGLLSILSVDEASPPSSATGPSVYGPATTNASLAGAASFALAAVAIERLPGTSRDDYAQDLLRRAEAAWRWSIENPDAQFRNNEGDATGVGYGQQETNDAGRARAWRRAAVYLFAATGKAEYHDYIKRTYRNTPVLRDDGQIDVHGERESTTMLWYTMLPGADDEVAAQIRRHYRDALRGEHLAQAVVDERSAYRAYMPPKYYRWGSNREVSRHGQLHLNLLLYGFDAAEDYDVREAALGSLHYIHGVNPQGMTYLSNMYALGVSRAPNEFYHLWYRDGSPKWDRVGVSEFGPAPGFLVGGPNPNYDRADCCPNACDSPEVNARCDSEPIEPPKNQPILKSYKDFNTSWPINSWEVTENHNEYQVTYLRLLSHFVKARENTSAFAHFITRDGHRLLDGDAPFRFIGLHATELHRIEDDIRGVCPHDARGWGQYFKWPTAEEQENWIKSLVRTGHTASRIYTLSVEQADDATCGRETHILAPATPDGFPRLNEKAMRVYDRMVALADQHGLRLILPFIDHWEWWGGRKQLAAFYGETDDDFYDTESRTYAAYLDVIRQVVTRRNTITGRHYFEEKAIMAWETGNELKFSTPAFVRRTAAYIKLLAPRQLVVDGNYLEILASSLDDPNVDIVTNHYYTHSEPLSAARVRRDLESIGGRKAFLVGEFGLAPLEQIRDVIDAVVAEDVDGARTAGALVWGFRGRRHEGGFYWHREGGSDYFSYHLPGFAENDDFDERAVLDAVRLAQARLLGRDVMDPLPVPEAPRLRAVGNDRVLRWMGAPVARSYRIERAAPGSDDWSIVADDVSDGVNGFDPRRDTLFVDREAAASGALYDYRVIAINESGESPPSARRSPAEFVSVDGTQFMLDGDPYRYVGTNVWYAAYLGSPDPAVGDRERLRRELDLLKANGITNLRILGASERSPLDNSLSPAISHRGVVEREDLLIGLDYALAEMAKRDMKAVIFLNNFWEWSGGMQTYLSWVNDGTFINLGDPAHPWPEFALSTAEFYSTPAAVALFNDYLATVVSRRNTVSGTLYRDDPTIMSWQLANEPRPGDGVVSRPNLPRYFAWIADTTARIKSLAPYQLVSVGSEGTMGCIEFDNCWLGAHRDNGIDYATFHLWIKNWGWFDVTRPAETFDSAMQRAGDYIDRHVEMATQLNMPVVLEEFGVERDGGRFDVAAPTSYRDGFFRMVFDRIEKSAAGGGPLVGSNFWTWGGYGRAEHADARWQNGDRAYTGDPPQEAQGLNSVFSTDQDTLAVLRDHAVELGTMFNREVILRPPKE